MLRESVMHNPNNDQLVLNVMVQTFFPRKHSIWLILLKQRLSCLNSVYDVYHPYPQNTLVSQSFWPLWLIKIYCKESQKNIDLYKSNYNRQASRYKISQMYVVQINYVLFSVQMELRVTRTNQLLKFKWYLERII